ncbi:MAG: antitoxin VapB family protein [Candidatus Bilamarchaeaceae archaeon]
MVKVITIMDEVYSELYKLKKSKGMSFSEAIRYLLDEHKESGSPIISFAGSISDDDIDKRAALRVKRGV